MKNFPPLIFVIVMILSFLLSDLSSIVHAKSCAAPVSGIAAMNATDAVFSSRVTKVKYIDNPEQKSPEPRIIVTMKVYKVWKGDVKKAITLHTVYNLWSGDGYFFKEGEEYLVFATKQEVEKSRYKDVPGTPKEIYAVFLCKGTTFLSQAGAFLKDLGTGENR